MNIAERNQLTARVYDMLQPMIGGRGAPDPYPGGAGGLLSELLIAWGIPTSPENIRNVVSEAHRDGEISHGNGPPRHKRDQTGPRSRKTEIVALRAKKWP